MSVNVTINGVTYPVPTQGDLNWGPPMTRVIVALANNSLSRSGGLFTLTADLNFGPTFGLLAPYYKSTTVNVATVGQLRLAKTDTIDWRNNANSGNNVLAVNGTDQLTFNGVTLNTGAGTVNAGTATHLAYYATSTNAVSDAQGANISGTYNFTQNQQFAAIGIGISPVGNSLTFATANAIRFKNSDLSQQITITAPAGVFPNSWSWTLPSAQGGTGTFLTNNGSGTLSWGTPVKPQFSSFSGLVETTTTSTTYVATGLTATITPSSVSSKVMIQVSGALEITGTGDNAIATIYRNNTTDLASGTQGFMFLDTPVTGTIVSGQSAVFVDSPATTSATTYTVYIKTSNGTSTVSWGVGGNQLTSSIILTEIL